MTKIYQFFLTTAFAFFTFDVSYDMDARWMRDSRLHAYLVDHYGWAQSDSPDVYFSQYEPLCNKSLCGFQSYKLNLASKANVAEIVKLQNLSSFVPKSYNLDDHKDLEDFEWEIPCQGRNKKWIFKTHYQEFGRGLTLPPEYSQIRSTYIVPFEDSCHDLYKNKSYDAVSIEYEDQIWDNRRRVVAQELVIPFIRSVGIRYEADLNKWVPSRSKMNVQHNTLRFYVVSFYPSKQNFIYRTPYWIFNPLQFDPLNAESVIYRKHCRQCAVDFFDHEVDDVPLDFEEVRFIATKLFEKAELLDTYESSQTKLWELVSMDFLIDEHGKLNFLLDLTQGPIIFINEFWPDFLELFFDLEGFPTERDHCTARFVKLETDESSNVDDVKGTSKGSENASPSICDEDMVDIKQINIQSEESK